MSRSDRLRRWPPLSGSLVALGLALFVLPSALNVPQSNPTQTLEFAPIPPQDDQPPPPEPGNVETLSLGTSSTAPAGDADGDAGPGLPPPPVPDGVGARPVTKRCVGNPPRQTEDPMSPPCVAHFDGDNGGATHRGVTGDEVRVVIYFDATSGGNVGGRFSGSPPPGSYCDLDLPRDGGDPGCREAESRADHGYVRFTRAYSNYFNARFQTFGRRVHYWVYFGSGSDPTEKRANAADILQTVDPFAVIDQSLTSGNDDAMFDALAARGVLGIPANYYGAEPHPASLYWQRAPHLWSFSPDVEHLVDNFVSYVCARVAPFLVTHTNATGIDGQPMRGRARVYAFYLPRDEDYPGLQLFGEQARERIISECGITPAVEASFAFNGDNVPSNPNDAAQARQDVAEMQAEGVTTMLWLGGTNHYTTPMMDSAGYYPEIVILGDGESDELFGSRLHPARVWENAWGISSLVFIERIAGEPGMVACFEGDPGMNRDQCMVAKNAYRQHFMLFRAIQVAGPNLSPTTVDQGMHAIPAIPSGDPAKPACFYDPGDYTCVKDLMEEWWDPNGQPADVTGIGCWRVVQGGRRHLADTWPTANEVFTDPDAPCNSWTFGFPGA